MSTPSLAAFAALCLALFSLIIGAGPGRPASNTAEVNPGLVVHEWGTFTSVSAQDGQALIWRPLSFESDLPSFVYSADKGHSWRGRRYPTKSDRPVRVRMETPVLYFYSEEQATVRVKVGFPDGDISEWYPQAQSAGRGGIDWGELRVMPRAHVALRHDFRENHYYPARETDAALVRVRNGKRAEYEKFLFYRGVGGFTLPLSVGLEGDKVVLENRQEENVRQVVLFENSGGSIGYRSLSMPETKMVVDRPVLNGRLPELRQEIKAMLITNGLYEKEADAMLNTWRDSWFEEGLRVFYIMPPKTIDTILPINIKPEPAELVRVLVGRTEIITPEMEQSVSNQISKLSEGSARDKKVARQEINKYGRFLESILTEILRHTSDTQLKLEVQRLLEEID